MENESFNPLSLLDKNQAFDAEKLKLLDNVVEALLDTKDKNRRDFAQNLLNQFKMLDTSWRSVSIILEHSENVNTKFYGLQILEECINNRWNILPSEEKEGMKNFIACYTITLSTEGTTVGVDRHLLNKLDETLIQIVKQEWPDSWSSFIPDIVNSAKLNQNVCENNMKLLNMLSEEVFEFGNETLVKKKKEKLRNEYASQFQEVYNLCLYILEANVYNKRSTNTSLIKQTLHCLSNFFKWIPLTYIFDKYKFNDNNIQIIDLLFDHFWDDISYKIECVKCIQEIVMLKIDEKNILYFDNVFINLWTKLVSKIKLLPNANEMKNIPPELKIFWEQYFLQLSICITSFLKNYREKIVEKNNNTNDVNIVFKFLNMLANSNMEEVFLIIIDYYNIFTEQLIRELITRLEQEHNFKNKNDMNSSSLDMKNTLTTNMNLDSSSLTNRKSYSFVTMNNDINLLNNNNNNNNSNNMNSSNMNSNMVININEYSSILDKIDLNPSDIKKMCPRIKLYEFILNDIRKTVIEKMAKPQEIYISYDNETGEVVRDFEPDTTEISLYNTMKTTLLLVFLDFLKIYQLYSKFINLEVEANGTKRIKHAQFRNLFLMKREFLHLIETTIERSCYNIQDLEKELLKREQKKLKNEIDESMEIHLPTIEEAKQINFQMTSNILNVLLETILVDYRDSNPHIKDAEVFSLLSTVFKKIENVTCPILPTVLNYVLLPTIDMIKNDFSSYPEHREKFYNFLDACVRHCFDYLFTLDSEIFNTFIQSLLWAIKHEHPSVADHGLRITQQFLHNIIIKKKEYLEEFCKAFYYIILNEILKTLTDSFHKSGFHYQTIILMNLLRLLEFEVVNIPEVEITKPHIIKHVQNFLTQSFENLNPKQIETFSVDMFNFCVESPSAFRSFVRDLLISLKEFATNQDELYEADRQEALQRAKMAEDNKLIKLRGLMKEDVPSFSAIDVDDECINVE
ncbi:hypothetical protein PFDG_04121 [Plasmodium falciparum Dd2]|uniref:Importin N-terminal domain-containing protein n=1 Tax=Plasmodium falciparum (isolate Dd2) TaxID=57267 RepID=A0A0L7M498_PLAF4|nr:hypothetical protein PFDG_04121 [Plasmodium falciparum Dd2]